MNAGDLVMVGFELREGWIDLEGDIGRYRVWQLPNNGNLKMEVTEEILTGHKKTFYLALVMDGSYVELPLLNVGQMFQLKELLGL